MVVWVALVCWAVLMVYTLISVEEEKHVPTPVNTHSKQKVLVSCPF